MLSELTILDLQKILFEEFSYKCSKEDASEIAISLVKFVETLTEIDNQNNNE